MPAEYEWIAALDAPDRADPSHVVYGPLGAGSISACLVARHEAALIERCLRSLQNVVDEIIVVHDGPCDDDTLTIAETYGGRVFVRPHYGHCEHHLPFAYQQARGDWLLTLDADEFLSSALRSSLRELTRATDVSGYEFLWPLWNGRQYISRSGPFKLALVRRSAMRMIGIIHSRGEVDGAIRRSTLQLEHQPPYNNYTLRTMRRKWGPRARLQAHEYLSDLNAVPRFNYPGTVRWTLRRQMMNRWARLMIVPAAIHTFLFVVRSLKGQVSLVQRIRFATTQGLYRGMVTASVARQRRTT